jgi:hypothetical protein
VSGQEPLLIGFGANHDFAFHIDGFDDGNAVRAQDAGDAIEKFVGGELDAGSEHVRSQRSEAESVDEVASGVVGSAEPKHADIQTRPVAARAD